jgi:hypothetical protein
VIVVVVVVVDDDEDIWEVMYDVMCRFFGVWNSDDWLRE